MRERTTKQWVIGKLRKDPLPAQLAAKQHPLGYTTVLAIESTYDLDVI